MSEEEFNLAMKQMAAGDMNALRHVYDAYLKLIYAICFKKLQHKEAAEDVTSDFFIRLYNSAASFNGQGHHKTWIATIAKNMCIDYMRKNKRVTESLDAAMYPDEDTASPREMADAKTVGGASVEEQTVNKLTIEQAMEKLSDKEREVMDLKCGGGLTFREIAETTGMPQGTVSWHYNNAVRKLRGYIGTG